MTLADLQDEPPWVQSLAIGSGVPEEIANVDQIKAIFGESIEQVFDIKRVFRCDACFAPEFGPLRWFSSESGWHGASIEMLDAGPVVGFRIR